MKVDWTLLTAFAAGAVAGAVTALLYAPSDGATLRTNLAEKTSESVEFASRKAEALSVIYGRKYQTARFQVERLFSGNRSQPVIYHRIYFLPARD